MVTANFGVSSWPLISTTRQTNSKGMSPPTTTAYMYVASRFLWPNCVFCILFHELVCRVLIFLETFLLVLQTLKMDSSLLLFALLGYICSSAQLYYFAFIVLDIYP